MDAAKIGIIPCEQSHLVPKARIVHSKQHLEHAAPSSDLRVGQTGTNTTKTEKRPCFQC